MKRSILWLMLLHLLILAGCGVSQSVYLAPGRYLAPSGGNAAAPRLLLQPFAEDVSRDVIAVEVVGEHRVGKKIQRFKIKPGAVSRTLDIMLGDLLIAYDIPFVRGEGWDLSLEGLRRLPGDNLVVGGRITKFSIDGATGVTRLATQLDLAMDIECLVADAAAGTIQRKKVHITEKVLKVSADQEDIEKVLDNFLASAAKQVMLNIEEFIR